MAAAAVERYGSLDILCANAGIFPVAKLDVMSGAEFDSVLTTNLRGTFLSVSALFARSKTSQGTHCGHLIDHRSDYGLSRLVTLWREQSRPTRLHSHSRHRACAGGGNHQCSDAWQHSDRGIEWSWARLHCKNGIVHPDEAARDG